MNLKKTLIAAAAASLFGGASFVVASSSRNSSDDLFMANVEALSQAETEGDGVDCYDSITTAPAQYTLYCGNCSVIPGKPLPWSQLGKCRP